MHKSITSDRIRRLVQADDNLGICKACGAEATGVEPDARNYKCEECGEASVFGAKELLFEVTT